MKLDTSKNAASLESAIVSLFYVGGVFGSFFQGWFSNAFGRKWSITFGCWLVIVSAALLTASVNPAMFTIFRFFNGWGATQLLCSVPLWITEVVPPRNRGMLVDIHAVQLNVGTVCSAYIGVGFFFDTSISAWRGPIALQMIPAAFVICGIYWIPESPRYLLMRGRDKEAWNIVCRLHSYVGDDTHAFASREFYQMQKQIEFEGAMKTSYLEILRRPSYRKRALLTTFLAFSLMSGGAFVINNYGATLYAGLGYDNLHSLLFQAGWSVISMFANTLAMTYVDKVRRDYLFATGFFLTGVCMLVEALLQRYYLNTTYAPGLGAAVAILFIFNLFYGMCLDGSVFFYIGELWPSHLRAQGYSLGLATLCATALIWTSAAPSAFATIGWKYYIIFVVFSFLACAVTLATFPNTRHKPLEEIAAMFGDASEVVVFQAELGKNKAPLQTAEKAQKEHVELV